MDNINVPVFAQAKVEYTKQLIDILHTHVFDGFNSIYNESKKIYITKTGIPILNIFRKLLENVPIWNNEIIEEETNRIIKISKCDWLEDLVTAVFISHTRILMSIGPNQNTQKINVSVPKTPNFIHKIYINVARDIWKNPYLYNENVAGHDRQRNMNRVDEMIKDNIEATIRKELPIKEILRGHLDTYENSEKLDLQLILNEMKKNNSQGIQEIDTENDDNGNDTDNETDNDTENGNDIDDGSRTPEVFNETAETVRETETPTYNAVETYDNVDIVDIVDTQQDMPSSITDNIYNDPEDPSIADIKKNTDNIVVNDITMPVVDESIPVPALSGGNAGPDGLVQINKIDDTPPTIGNIVTEKPPDKDVKMFSFDTLYPGMKTFGSVKKEDKIMSPLGSITEGEKVVDENIDKTLENISSNNDKVLQEIMKLDKREENIDETETLDNFFKDVKEIANESDKTVDVNTKETSYTFFD